MSEHNGSCTADSGSSAKHSISFILNADGSEPEPSLHNSTLRNSETIAASSHSAQPRCSTERSVVILTKPLSGALWLGWFADTSAGKTSLNHWGVLVTELDERTIQEALTSTEHRYAKAIQLGTLLELSR